MSYIGNTPTDAPVTVAYITQTPSGVLTAEQALSPLSTGLLKNTTGTGVLTIAVGNTDYVTPTASLLSLASFTSTQVSHLSTIGSFTTTEMSNLQTFVDYSATQISHLTTVGSFTTSEMSNLQTFVDYTSSQVTNLTSLASYSSAQMTNLSTISGFTAASNNIMVGNGTAWTLKSGSTARSALGLGTTDNVQFNDIDFIDRVLNNGTLFVHLTGSQNLFIGSGAGNTSATASSTCVGIGLNALSLLSTGGDNISIGAFAATVLSSSNRCIAIGRQALWSGTTGVSDSIAIGYQALLNNLSNQCVGIGTSALSGGTSFSGCTALGYQAGTSNTGNNNTYLGASTLAAVGITNATAIGAGATVSTSNSMVLGNGVNVGIGTSSPANKLDVVGNINTTTQYSVSGTKVVGARATGWTAATGTANRATWDTSTVTLATLAQAVKALNDDLRTHGLIGT